MKRLITLLLPALLALTACSLEDSGQRGTLQAGETMASFTVDLPNEFSGPQGYALAIDNDKVVNEFHVLAFDSENNLADWATQTDITGAEGSPSFNVKFKKLTIGSKYTFVVLANAGAQIDALSITFSSKPSYQVLMPKFIQDDGGDSNVTRIPMWGEAEVASLAANNSITEMPLLRMMAKINVSADLEGSDTFIIEDVRLINYRQDGRIVPDKANIDANKKAIAPTLTVKGRSDDPLFYDFQSGAFPIYAFEADVAGSVSDPNLEQVHCLVIGATYNNGDKSYYRVNFSLKDGAGNVTYLPLLRNHSYNIKITGVNGDGYVNWEDAFKSKGLSVLEADIIEWNDADMTDIDFDGQYMLSVTKKAWTFDASGRAAQASDNVIRIDTDWTDGWEEVSSSEWLDLKQISGKDYYIFVKPHDLTTDRTGEIVIKAGRITTKITVKQTGKSATIPVTDISISQSDITLEINGTYNLPEVLFTPEGATNKGYTWTSSDPNKVEVINNASILAKAEGEATITVTTIDGKFPKSFNVTVNPPVPTIISISLSTYATTVFKGNSVTLIATIEPSEKAGETITWSLNGSTNVSIEPSGNTVVVTGESVGTANITATAGGITSIACVVTVTEGTYEPSTHKGWAGSNIYWDGTKLTFDNDNESTHAGYQGVFFKWGSLTGMAPNGNFGTGTTVYLPDGTTATGKTYASIPVVGTQSIKQNRNQAYLYEIHNVDSGLGDICKHLTDMGWAPGAAEGKRWRMPTSNEFEAAGDYTKVGGFAATTASNAGGQSTIGSGYNKASGPFFPAAGSRSTDGTLYGVGVNGFYWASSPHGTNGRNLYFNSAGVVDPVYYHPRPYGHTVRCVVE